MPRNWDFVFKNEEKQNKSKRNWDAILNPQPVIQKPDLVVDLGQSIKPIEGVKIPEGLEGEELAKWLRENVKPSGQTISQATGNERPANIEYIHDTSKSKPWDTYYGGGTPLNPFAQGLMDAIIPKGTSLNPKDDFQQMIQEQNKGKAILGNLTGQAMKYAGIAKLAPKIPLINKISNPFIRNLTADQIVDNIAQTPQTIIEGVKENKSGGEIAKDVGVQNLVDLGFNLVVGGASEAIKALRKGKITKVQMPEEMALTSKNTAQSAPKVKGIKSNAINRLEKVYQKWNDAMEEIHNHFMHYELTPDEVKRIKPELGIDLDALIKEMAEAENAAKLTKESLKKMGERTQLAIKAGVIDKPKLDFPDNIKNTNINISIKDKTNAIIDSTKRNKGELKGNLDLQKVLDKLPTNDQITSYAQSGKDINWIERGFQDLYRNTKKVFGENYDKVKKLLLDPFDDAKAKNIQMQEDWINKLKSEIVDKLGINKGSKLSAAIQQYGEGRISEKELLQKFTKEEVEKIKQADKWFRDAYNNLLNQVNMARAKAYPGKEDMLIKPRKDYYRHFKELGQITGLKNLFESPSNLRPTTLGKDDLTKPLSKYFSIGKERKGSLDFTDDAVGGFLDYIRHASYATHIDPQIPKFRKLADQLQKSDKAPELKNYIAFLNMFADDLSGKAGPLATSVKRAIGDQAFNVLDWLNRRAKANVIMGKVASSLSQIANVPQGVAHVKDPKALSNAAYDTIMSIIKKDKWDGPFSQSKFLKERYIDDLYTQFDKRLIDQPKKFAAWLLEVLDSVGSRFIWSAEYHKALKQGIENPIKYADEMTRNLIAGRGVGEVPIIQKDAFFQMIAPFQLEVANLWNVQKDMIKEKDFAGILILFVANHLLNDTMEAIRGNRIIFDPIQAIEDAINKDVNPVGRMAGEVLSNMPLGQSIAAVVPEQQREKFFGDEDPTRYGTGLVLQRALQHPLSSLVPAYGGDQIRKTYEGLRDLAVLPEINPFKENFGEKHPLPGAYNVRNNKRTLRYPINNDPASQLKSVLFGPNTTRKAQEYYDNDYMPLTENQTKGILHSSNPKIQYDIIQKQRKIARIRNEIDLIASDNSLSNEEKQKKINKLIQEIQEVVKELQSLGG